MNRREFLKLASGMAAMAVIAPSSGYDVIRDAESMFDHGYLELEDIKSLTNNGDYKKCQLCFYCQEGKIVKNISIGHSYSEHEVAYQMAKRTREAIRDMLLMRHGRDWRRPEFEKRNLAYLAEQIGKVI